MTVDYRETLVTYLNSQSTAEAAKALNISKQTLAARVKFLRKAGVKVPKKTGRVSLSPLDVSQFNSLIHKWQKDQA
ncbi:helix-turn-helix domain-containing protein [Rhodococcus erythropolis]|uniref:helix-turn-helix domain-containing protein n=1 Tax=Rhodococcus erythropolis TaxID=1833 RepID=UPI003AF3ABDB